MHSCATPTLEAHHAVLRHAGEKHSLERVGRVVSNRLGL